MMVKVSKRAIAVTLAEVAKMNPCTEAFVLARETLPPRKRITAEMAQANGIDLDNILWVLTHLANTDADTKRRLRLWSADCAAHVLGIYEKAEKSVAPREAIVATRKFARREITYAAKAASSAAAWGAEVDAWVAARTATCFAASAAAAATWAAEDAAWVAARAAQAATRDAEETWQYDRLVMWMSADEPEDWPLAEWDEDNA